MMYWWYLDIGWFCDTQSEYSNLTLKPFQEQYRVLSVGVLMQYLSDSAIAPLQRDLVEIADPYCSKVTIKPGKYHC